VWIADRFFIFFATAEWGTFLDLLAFRIFMKRLTPTRINPRHFGTDITDIRVWIRINLQKSGLELWIIFWACWRLGSLSALVRH